MSLLQKEFTAAGRTISVEQWLLLVNLRNEDGQFHQQLADNTYKDKTTVTRLVDGLERNGYVERVPDDADRRQKRIRITRKGKKTLTDLKPLALDVQQKVLQGVARDELDACTETLLKIYENANRG